MELQVSPAGSGQAPIVTGFDAIRWLGNGAQGQVWLLAPRDGGPAVAAKILAPGLDAATGGDDVAERHNESHVTQEWRILTQFCHEHLIPVHGLVRDSQGGLVLLMDYAAGGSLGQVVRAKGPLTVGETVTVLTPLGQVLSFLHGRGAVHGDVSAGNVLLSAAGKPFLGDFGLGRLLGQGAAALTGTPGFVCEQDAERDEAADVYGMAAVGWFALTGHAPPPSRDRLPLTTFVRDVPTELLAALEAGLQEEARQRPTAAAFAQAVFRSARAEPVALANAVHPSVLPELLTRREERTKRPRGRRGGKLHFMRRLGATPSPRLWPRTGRGTGERRRLGRLWGDAIPSRRDLHVTKATMPVAVILAALVLAAGGLLLGPTLFSGAGPEAQGGASGQALDNRQTPSMAWAAGLPQEIQRDLAAQEPVQALAALAWTRSYALSHADAALVANINAPGSPTLAADTTIVADLATSGHSFTGLETRIGDAVLTVGSASSKATVRATVTTSSFAEHDAQGAVVHNHAQEQRQELNIVLTRMEERWVIEQILPADTKK
ncbi:MAG: protein kinase [Specibacter sp.]